MESITKEAIKAIAELGINNSQTLGELFSRIYFKKDQYALFLDETNQTVELLIAIKDNNRDNVTRLNRITFYIFLIIKLYIQYSL